MLLITACRGRSVKGLHVGNGRSYLHVGHTTLGLSVTGCSLELLRVVVPRGGLRYEQPPRKASPRLSRAMYSDYDTMRTMLRLAHGSATFSLRRTLFADGLVSLVTGIGAINRLAARLDDRLYPGHRDQPVGKPIYIVAAPRSGTTFLHRLMSRDPQFTTFKMMETFFPTITGHKVIDRLTNVNGTTGALFDRLLKAIDSSSFGAWEGIHDTGLNQDEEDEAIWALAFATPAIWLVLPFPEQFDHLRFVDALPREKRERLVSYYRDVVQRHLHTRPGKTLLGKNVLLPGRFEIVTGALPDARFVHVLRHPYEALPSMLSLFTIPWRWHSPEIRLDGPETRALTQLTIDYYRFLHRQSVESEQRGEQQFFNVTYQDLLADPLRTVRQIYDRFSLELTPEVETTLKNEVAQQRSYRSDHKYSLEQFGLSKEYVYEQLKDLFEQYDFAR